MFPLQDEVWRRRGIHLGTQDPSLPPPPYPLHALNLNLELHHPLLAGNLVAPAHPLHQQAVVLKMPLAPLHHLLGADHLPHPHHEGTLHPHPHLGKTVIFKLQCFDIMTVFKLIVVKMILGHGVNKRGPAMSELFLVWILKS